MRVRETELYTHVVIALNIIQSMKKRERALCWEVLFIIYLDLFPSRMWRSVFFSPMKKKNKDAVLLEVKADGLQGAKLPHTLSTKRCQAEGPSYVFTGTLSTSVQPPLPYFEKKKVVKTRETKKRVTRTLNVALTFGLTNSPVSKWKWQSHKILQYVVGRSLKRSPTLTLTISSR